MPEDKTNLMHPTIYKASYPNQINPRLSSFCQSILLFKGLILFILLFLSSSTVAQLTVVDERGKPISYVEVFSNNKRFYAKTNHLGEINSQKLVKLKEYDTLVFQHYFYVSKAVKNGELHPGDTLVLLERIFETEEIAIVANKADPKFLKLEACYRSCQYNDDSLTYYIDGKADFISKTSKAKFKRYTKERRSFSNEKIVKEIPQHKVGVIFSPSVPYPPSYFLPLTFSEKYDLMYVNVDSIKVEFYTQDSVLMGYYEKHGGFVTYVIHDIGFVRTYNLFNSEIQRLSREVILVFKAKPGIKVEDIASFDDLLYYKNVGELNVKHDKDKVFTNIVQVSEFYIEDVIHLQEFDKKNYGDSLRAEYTRSADFWKRCDCIYYQEPNQYLWQNLQRDY